MRIKTAHALVVTLVIAALPAACKDNPTPPAPTPAASSVAPQSSAPIASASASASGSAATADDAGGGRRHGDRGQHARGASGMFFRATKDLADLKDDQKAKIEAAEKSTRETGGESREALKKAGKDLHTDLIAAIKAGKVEAAKLEPKYADIEKAMKAAHEKEAEGLNQLHAALTAPQRKAVALDVKKKHEQMEERMAKREEHNKEKGDGGKPESRGKKHIERLTADLDLDADQQKKVGAITPPEMAMPDRAEMKKRSEALLAAFEKDTFDAKKIDAFDAKKARAPMEAETKVVSAIVPILKPEQREKLAAKMEKGPSPHGRRGGGGGGFDHNKAADDDDGDDD